jgi:hypothetical protein
LKKIKFSPIDLPSFSKEKHALGILFQFLSETLGVLNREKKASELGFFVRERLEPRDRRIVFSILNQLQVQVGLRMDFLKGHGDLKEEAMGKFNNNGAFCYFKRAQELLLLLDDFANSHESSSVDNKFNAQENLANEVIRLSISFEDEKGEK